MNLKTKLKKIDENDIDTNFRIKYIFKLVNEIIKEKKRRKNNELKNQT